MKNTILGLNLFSGSGIFLNKLIACLVFFCIITASANIVNNYSEPIVTDSTIQISAQTLFIQFFYISALPANLISKLFLSKQADPISNKKQEDEQKNSNSSKASVGYSILPAQAYLTNNLQHSKLNNTFALFVNFASFMKNYCFNSSGGMPSCVCVFNSDKIKMLLLAISLARRNVGEDNIFTINIKNNDSAQLT